MGLRIRALAGGAGACAALAFAWQPATARAFSDPASYDDSTDAGGGGGRWFTASPADGYGCDICHRGGAPIALSVAGLPLEGFAPNTAYAVTLSWPAALKDLSLIAEFTDEQGSSAGSLALPVRDDYTPDDLCSPEEGGAPATDLYPALDGRSMLGVVDCGAHVARFQWTAPAAATGKIWFNAGFVASNDDATPLGDGVTLAKRVLTPLGQSDARSVATSGCSVARVARTPEARASWLLAIGISWMVRSWRRVVV